MWAVPCLNWQDFVSQKRERGRERERGGRVRGGEVVGPASISLHHFSLSFHPLLTLTLPFPPILLSFPNSSFPSILPPPLSSTSTFIPFRLERWKVYITLTLQRLNDCVAYNMYCRVHRTKNSSWLFWPTRPPSAWRTTSAAAWTLTTTARTMAIRYVHSHPNIILISLKGLCHQFRVGQKRYHTFE